ncbi:MAG: sigma-70 family RNA polymerase sigma factor [Bacteroidales bacterium]|nr:sigma-70 family RNA polymerase sigma factor [Bacteroidales bacterium]
MMNNDSVHNKTIEESILSDDYDGLFPNDDVEYQKKIIAMACSSDPAISSKGSDLVYYQYDRYIKFILKTRFKTYRDNERINADLLQECREELFRCLPEYDPDRGLPKDFLYSKILNKATEYVSVKFYRRSTHYNQLLKKIDAAEKELKAVGIDNPNEFQLQKVTGIPPRSIVNALAHRNQEVEFNEKNCENTQLSNPEDLMIKSEIGNVLMKALGQLSDNEKMCVYYHSGMYNGKKITYKVIAKALGISVSDANLLYKNGIRKLQKMPSVRACKDTVDNDITNDLGGETVSVVPTFEADVMFDQLAMADDGLEIEILNEGGDSNE